MSYQGWTNHETWSVNLWLTNSEGDFQWMEELAKQAKYKPREMADLLQDSLLEMMPPLPNGIFSDLLESAFANVNWFEIAKSFIDEMEIEEDEK